MNESNVFWMCVVVSVVGIFPLDHGNNHTPPPTITATMP